MMPIYNYICRQCGHEESKMVDSKNRDTEVECSECSSLALDRVQTKLPQHNHLRAGNEGRFDKIKERLETEQMMYSLPQDDREDYEEHLAKLEEAENKERLPSDKEDFHKHKSGIDITK